MGFFNLVETFFFISLAITFVLIMMLVYHFKERLTILESKSETILEIIHNLMKENSVLKSGYLQIVQSIQNSRVPSEKEQQPTYNRILVSEDESDDDDEYESDEDSDNELEEQLPVIKQIQIHSGFTTEINDIDELGENEFDGIDFEKTANELEDLEVDINELDDNDESEEIDSGINEIIVTKLDDILQVDEIDGDSENIRENEESEENTNISNFVQPVEVYRKMDISELRSIVIQKGLATDTKKLKKMDLIRLLTNTTE